MIGSIIGDVVGSRFEFNNIKKKKFKLFSKKDTFTDDSVLTIATAEWLLHGGDVKNYYARWASKYPSAGYGGHFLNRVRLMKWVGDAQPYNSCGNGSAMSISPVGWAFETLEETLEAARVSAECTHNHPEGIKGAQAVVLCIYMARNGALKNEIRREVEHLFGYDLDFTIDGVRPTYGCESELGNGVLCQASVPQAIVAFLEGSDFEDCIRNAISLGGHSNTIGCITGSIAEAFYGVPQFIREEVNRYLPDEFMLVIHDFEKTFPSRHWAYSKYHLRRFVDVQKRYYTRALREIRNHEMRCDWLDYVFPRLHSENPMEFEPYGFDNEDQAKAYLEHQILGSRLREACQTLLEHKGYCDIYQLMRYHTTVKELRLSMKLFDRLSPNDIFKEVLEAYYPSEIDILCQNTE